MKKILLIEPGSEVSTFPPIGLLHIASAIRDKSEVFIKDYSGIKINEEEIRKTIEKIDPFIVGLRVLTGPNIDRALKISKIAKQLGKIVVWGGPHPTILPEQTLENEYIDSVVIGEGEYSFQDLIKYYEGKLKEINGIGIKKNGKIIITLPHKKIVDFKDLKLPAWDLLEDIDRYFPDKNHNSLPISTTRGCVFKCGFCHNSNENVKKYLGCYRIAPPERAFEELKFVQSLVKNKIDYLNVGEDLHLISYDYSKKFCEAYEKSGMKDIMWETSTRYAILNEEIVEMIAKHNCKRVLLGVESGSKRIQEMNGKIIDFEHAKKIAKQLRSKGIFVTNAYIFGHPTETEEELKLTIKLIKEIPADENLIQLYRPMPKTPYFEICAKDNKVEIPTKLENWSGFGVLGKDTNVSKIPSQILFSTYYRTNAVEQSKYWYNQQKYFLKNSSYSLFLKNFIENRFTHKLKELIVAKNEKN